MDERPILWGSPDGREHLVAMAREMGYSGPVRTRDDLPYLRTLHPERRCSDRETDFAGLGQSLRDLLALHPQTRPSDRETDFAALGQLLRDSLNGRPGA